MIEQIDQILNGKRDLGEVYDFGNVPAELHAIFVRYAGPQINRSLYRLKITDKKIVGRDRDVIKKHLWRSSCFDSERQEKRGLK